jgi:mannose-6-phosphate isomerase-like protein (cupin superfamily)
MPIRYVPDQVRFQAEKMAKVSLFETPRMFCDVYCLEPGQSQSPHTHTGADKVYYVLDGTGEFVLGDERHALGPGHAVMAPSGVVHGVSNPGEERLTLLVWMAPNPNVR